MADETTVVAEPEKDEVTGKFIFHYQPRDSEGQFIGRPYKFLYTDHQDLVKQIAEAKEQADRTIHEIKIGKRKIVGEAAVKNPDWTPAPEPAEDEEKRKREDFRKVAEAEFGAPLDSVRQNLRKAQLLDEYMVAQNWALNNPEYYACRENAEKMEKYRKEKNLALTASNLDLIFEELRDSLATAPAAPADSTQQQVEPTKEQPKPRSTGIVPGQFQGTRPGTRQETRPLTVERFRQIDRMSRDQFNALRKSNPKEYWAFVEMKSPKAQPQQ